MTFTFIQSGTKSDFSEKEILTGHQ
ncbi:hypothetical protein EMIT0111MI5_80226 [Burkholderia sp. IT-111MI5]